MRLSVAVALALISLGLQPPAGAQQSFPYSCEWVSEVTPEAVIRFTGTNGVGAYRGALTYRGRRLMAFEEGQSQGYGSHWWSSGAENGPSGQVVVFAGDRVVRGTPGVWEGRRPAGVGRVLLVGLGSALYYGSDPRWREDRALLTAAEGFWRLSPGCRALG